MWQLGVAHTVTHQVIARTAYYRLSLLPKELKSQHQTQKKARSKHTAAFRAFK